MKCSHENLSKIQLDLSLVQASTPECLELGMKQLFCQVVRVLAVVEEGKDVGLTVDKCAVTRKFQPKNSSYQFIKQELIWNDSC